MDCLNQKMLIKLAEELFYKGDTKHPVFEVNSIHSYALGEVSVFGCIYLIDYEEDYVEVNLWSYFDTDVGHVTSIECYNGEGFTYKYFFYYHEIDEMYSKIQFDNLKERIHFMK